MVEVGLEENYDSDSSGNEEQYSKLVYSVSQLDSTQRVKPASRKELTSEVSEYNLIKGGSEADHVVDVNELAAALQKRGTHKALDRKLKTFTEKAKTLSKPLEKPEADKIKRQIGFSFIKDRLRKWDAIVSRNRLNDHQTFPLQQSDITLEDERSRLFKKFKPMTPLENEISKILKLNKDEEKEEEDETLEFPLTLEEMIERRKEMASLRARQSYKEAKAHRQHKIKSKKYHRILKREKIKEQMKEFEQLQRTDPEAALKKLIEIDKIRAQERASLRHRNTGKWSKNLIVRAKYDKETRKVLADQLSVSRDLTKKVKQVDSDEEKEENEDSFNPSKMFVDSADNPWNLEVSSEVTDFVSGYRKFWMEKNKTGKSKDSEVVNGDAGKSTNSKNIGSNETNVTSDKSNQENSENADKINETNLKVNSEQPSKSEKLKRKKKIKETESKRIKINGENKLVNQSESSKGKKPKVGGSPEKRKENGRAEKKYVIDSMASGLWIVSPIKEEIENKKVESSEKSKKSKEKSNSKKNNVDIDDMFDHVEKKLEKRIKQKLKKIESKLNTEGEKKENANDDSESDAEIDLSIKKYRNAIQRPDEDLGLSEVAGGESVPVIEAEISAVPENAPKISAATSFEIDPKKYIQVKPKNLSTSVPDEIMGGEDAIDDAEEQKMTIMEAFADDNVIEEFKEMKEQEAKSTQLDEVVPTLPGWGSWGGTGIKPKKRKKPRLFNVPLPARKDHNKEDIIINEQANPKIKDHLVKDLPRPFTAVSDFEANVRAPIGRDWIPETAHRKLIEKPVETKLGAVIEPMNTHHIYKMDKEIKSAFKKKQKEKIISGGKK